MSKKYSKKSLVDAVSSTLDSKSASKFYNIPASTIRRHRRNSSLRNKVGRPSYLTTTQELYFTALLQVLPDYGIQISTETAVKLASDYFISLGLSDTPGKKWLFSFVERHSDDIKWQKEAKLERAREETFTEKVRTSWFEILEGVLKKYNLFDKPNNIFNVDETGFSDHTKGEWVIVKSSRRHVFEKNGGSGKDHRTALVCVSAGGFILSPLFLYSGKNLMESWCIGGPTGAHYGITEKGWMNTVMFEYWLEFMFIPSTAHIGRPLLLIFDGYSSHVSLKIVNLLKDNAIICLMLPSHSTHALQPVDIVLFSSVKYDWSKIVKNHFKEGSKNIKNSDFPRLMKKLFVEKKAFCPTRIVSSFSRSGIWPFDNQAMRDKVSQNNNDLSSTITNDSYPEPTNVLTPSHSSLNSSFISSTNISINDANDPVTQMISSSPLQLVLVDHQDIPPPLPLVLVDYQDIPSSPLLDNPSYVDLQPCTLDFTPEQSRRVEQTTNSHQEDDKNHQKTLFDTAADDTLLSTPMNAVRHVMCEILSQREEQKRLTAASAKPVRSSRLRSTIGLNITEDEYVLTKLKEQEEKKKVKEEKQNRIKKPRAGKGDSSAMKLTNNNTKRTKRANAINVKTKNKENRIPKDPELAFGIQLLQDAIDFTQEMDDNNNDSDDGQSSFLC